MSKKIFYENNAKHYMNNVIWYTFDAFPADIFTDLSLLFPEKPDGVITDTASVRILMWKSLSDEEAILLTRKVFAKLLTWLTEYGSIKNTPTEEIEDFYKKNKFVTPNEFYEYCDRATVKYNDTDICLNVVYFNRFEYGYKAPLIAILDDEGSSIENITLSSLFFKNIEKDIPYDDIWSTLSTGYYDPDGAILNIGDDRLYTGERLQENGFITFYDTPDDFDEVVLNVRTDYGDLYTHPTVLVLTTKQDGEIIFKCAGENRYDNYTNVAGIFTIIFNMDRVVIEGSFKSLVNLNILDLSNASSVDCNAFREMENLRTVILPKDPSAMFKNPTSDVLYDTPLTFYNSGVQTFMNTEFYTVDQLRCITSNTPWADERGYGAGPR